MLGDFFLTEILHDLFPLEIVRNFSLSETLDVIAGDFPPSAIDRAHSVDSVDIGVVDGDRPGIFRRNMLNDCHGRDRSGIFRDQDRSGDDSVDIDVVGRDRSEIF
jgi:hypothetical protein